MGGSPGAQFGWLGTKSLVSVRQNVRTNLQRSQCVFGLVDLEFDLNGDL